MELKYSQNINLLKFGFKPDLSSALPIHSFAIPFAAPTPPHVAA